MSEIKDGGPAFPLLNPAIGYHADIRQTAFGLSVRDYFAAEAMLGMLSNASVFDGVSDDAMKYISEGAYMFADAMLKARQS